MAYTLILASIGAVLIGFLSGVLSLYFVTRKQSILGDAITHSTFPGITIAFFIIMQKNYIFIMIGAVTSALIAILIILLIRHWGCLADDANIAVILSIFFGFGILMLTVIQKSNSLAQSGLIHYIFGNITFILKKDIYVIIVLSFAEFVILALFWKEFKLITFDRQYAITLGYPVLLLDILLMFMIAITAVIGVDIIGTVMMAALLIAPAVAGRQWSNNFFHIAIISGLFGSLSGLVGTFLSSNISNMPPGPIIVVTLSSFVLLSILFGKEKGILWQYFRFRETSVKTDDLSLLNKFFGVCSDPLTCCPSHNVGVFEVHSSEIEQKEPAIKNMMKLGYIRKMEDNKLSLTIKGLSKVEKYNMMDKLEVEE